MEINNKFNIGDQVYIVLCHPDPVYRKIICPTCNGIGVLYNNKSKEFKCNNCYGKKEVDSTYDDFYSKWFVVSPIETPGKCEIVKIVYTGESIIEYCIQGLDKNWNNHYGHFANHSIQREDRLFYTFEEAQIECNRLIEESKIKQIGRINQIR